MVNVEGRKIVVCNSRIRWSSTGGGEEVLVNCITTAEMRRETAREILGVTSGQRKEDKGTLNEEIQRDIIGDNLT